MLRPEDLEQLNQKGITEEQVEAQLARFRTGFPYLKINDAARSGQGIVVLDEAERKEAVERWHKYLADGGEVCKFVPASGAASRMFKALFEFVDGDEDVPVPGSAVEKLIADIDKLAFIADLNATTQRLHGKSVHQLVDEKRYKDIIAAIIKPGRSLTASRR